MKNDKFSSIDKYNFNFWLQFNINKKMHFPEF